MKRQMEYETAIRPRTASTEPISIEGEVRSGNVRLCMPKCASKSMHRGSYA